MIKLSFLVVGDVNSMRNEEVCGLVASLDAAVGLEQNGESAQKQLTKNGLTPHEIQQVITLRNGINLFQFDRAAAEKQMSDILADIRKRFGADTSGGLLARLDAVAGPDVEKWRIEFVEALKNVRRRVSSGDLNGGEAEDAVAAIEAAAQQPESRRV